MPQAVAGILLAVLWLMLFPTAVEAGHELPYYPSYYPQEIRLESIASPAAATLLQKSAIHAYIGGDPFPNAQPLAAIAAAASFGAYLVVTFNPVSAALPNREQRCTAASQLLDALEHAHTSYRAHPYPVTPYHMDYLHHFDRVMSAQQAHQQPLTQANGAASLRVSLRAAALPRGVALPARWQVAEAPWDAVIEAIDLNTLLADEHSSLNGWQGPPWLKEGWYHAYRLLGPHLNDGVARSVIDALYARLTNGHYQGQVERLNLERQLVALLTQSCGRVVLGYTVQHEYYNADFSAGLENIAVDAQAGFNSAIFMRTVKLKDFPWNGWLKVGIASTPRAAWNPIGGFSDAAGRLIWCALGDPALLPAPHNSTWMANRFSPNIAVVDLGQEGSSVPPDVLLPDVSNGRLQPVGEGARAAVKLTYRGLMSVFHDGTSMTVADLLYPYSIAARWGTRRSADLLDYDPAIEASTALMRAKLAGVRVLHVEQEAKAFGELKLTQDVPVVEVYLQEISPDFPHVAAVAPPWSTLPWHLMVLMEAAVQRGFAAFSAAEAERRGLPWLDLVRDQRLKDQLSALVADFEVRGYRPEALQGLVTEAEARQRWGALKSFAIAHGHFLVTNGPYTLGQWDDRAVVLQVFRDLSYPLGMGSYDKYAYPPRALSVKLETRRHRLELSAELEKVEKAQRSYHLVREPLNNQAMVGVYRVKVLAPYVVLSLQGEVLKAGSASYAGDGIFAIELSGKVPPGRYTVLTTIYVNDNSIEPDIKMVSLQVD